MHFSCDAVQEEMETLSKPLKGKAAGSLEEAERFCSRIFKVIDDATGKKGEISSLNDLGGALSKSSYSTKGIKKQDDLIGGSLTGGGNLVGFSMGLDDEEEMQQAAAVTAILKDKTKISDKYAGMKKKKKKKRKGKKAQDKKAEAAQTKDDGFTKV